MFIAYSDLDNRAQHDIAQTVCDHLNKEFGRSVELKLLVHALLIFEVHVELESAEKFYLRLDENLEGAVKYISARF